MTEYAHSESVASAEERPNLAFGRFVLDMERATLIRDGEVVALRPKSFDVLRHLVEHAGKLVSKDEIFDAVWPGLIVTPDSINQCVIEIRKALGDDSHELIRTVPRRGYVFEGTVAVRQPAGDKETYSALNNDEPASSFFRLGFRQLVVAAIVGLVLAVAWLYFPESSTPNSYVQKVSAAAGASHEEASIAVLPFKDMSQQHNQQYFGDGLAESLLDQLAKIPQLRVISRVSAFSFKGKEETIPNIARQLNVAHILEGSVRVSGDRIRIAAQLIDARTDTHLWSQTYDRSIGNIFAIQDDISERVVQELKVKLLGEPAHARKTDPKVYALYLKARSADIKSKVKPLLQALNIDPGYAPAWFELGDAYFKQGINGLREKLEARALARSAAERALALDPNDARVHALLGAMATTTNDLAGAARELETALAIDANDTYVLYWSGRLLDSLGRFDEAFALYQRLAARNPLDGQSYFALWTTATLAGRLDEAEGFIRRVISLHPDAYLGRVFLAGTLAFEGKYQEALGQLRELGSTGGPGHNIDFYRLPNPLLLIFEAYSYHEMGKTTELQAVIKQFESTMKEADYINGEPTQLFGDKARFYAAIGDADRAFMWLDRTLEAYQGRYWLAQERYWPLYQPIRNDPRWQKFLVKAGVSDAQLSRIKFSVSPQAKPSQSKQIRVAHMPRG